MGTKVQRTWKAVHAILMRTQRIKAFSWERENCAWTKTGTCRNSNRRFKGKTNSLVFDALINDEGFQACWRSWGSLRQNLFDGKRAWMRSNIFEGRNRLIKRNGGL